jgi:hypothetical protein
MLVLEALWWAWSGCIVLVVDRRCGAVLLADCVVVLRLAYAAMRLPRCRHIGLLKEPYRAAGATWWLAEFAADAVSVDRVHAVIRDGPIAHP